MSTHTYIYIYIYIRSARPTHQAMATSTMAEEPQRIQSMFPTNGRTNGWIMQAVFGVSCHLFGVRLSVKMYEHMATDTVMLAVYFRENGACPCRGYKSEGTVGKAKGHPRTSLGWSSLRFFISRVEGILHCTLTDCRKENKALI